MIKKRVGLSLLAFTVSLLTGCGKGANNYTAGNGAGANAAGGQVSGTLPSPAGTPGAAKSVRVRLVLVETNADLIDAPIKGSEVILRAGETEFIKRTNNYGVVLFDSVPCVSSVVITARDGESGEDTVLNRALGCSGPEADLGLLVRPFGGKFILEQRRPQHVEYDPVKNEWRTPEGRVVPNETIKGILGKYQ